MVVLSLVVGQLPGQYLSKVLASWRCQLCRRLNKVIGKQEACLEAV